MYSISDRVCSWSLCEYISDIAIHENHMIFNLSLHCFVNSLSVTDKNSLFKEIIKCIFFNYACMHLTLHVYNLLVLNIGDLVYLSFVMIHYTVQTYSLVQLKLILFNFNCLSNNLRFYKSISLWHKNVPLLFVFYRKILLEVWMKIYRPDKIGQQRGLTVLLVELS